MTPPVSQPRRGCATYTIPLPESHAKKKGKQFVFFTAKGERVTDEADIARIRKLAIPPAYKDVWICPHLDGHLQATGIDARGRKQYRYHPQWRIIRDASKFHHMLAFGEALPRIRAATRAHLSQRGLTRQKILATVVTLLERTMIRVGNDEYAKSNESYGLTTLREEHVDVSGQTVRFHFKGKSGKQWDVKLSDRRIASVIRACEEIEGHELFKYTDGNGAVHSIGSADVNGYLREITNEHFTAKDFRTFSGTVLAAIALQEYEHYDSAAQAKKHVVAAIEHVARKLGNTPSICRKCYVHPEIITAYMEGGFTEQLRQDIDREMREGYDHLSDEEILVLAFLKKRLHAAS